MKSEKKQILLPAHMRPLYIVSSLAKPFIFQDACGNLQEGKFVITVQYGEDYYVVSQRTRKFTGPEFNKADYDTLVRLLTQAYIKFNADIGQMDTWVPGVECIIFPWFFETLGEAEYYIELFRNQQMDMVRSSKDLTQIPWSQFYRDYYSVI